MCSWKGFGELRAVWRRIDYMDLACALSVRSPWHTREQFLFPMEAGEALLWKCVFSFIRPLFYDILSRKTVRDAEAELRTAIPGRYG